MRELHYPTGVPFDQDMNPGFVSASLNDVIWYKPDTPPMMATEDTVVLPWFNPVPSWSVVAAEERKPADIEKTINDVLGDLRGKDVSGGAAKQIRDAATERVRQVESDQSFHRAIRGQS